MSNAKGFILGIDLGANSLGTALIDWNSQQVIFTGVRIFKAGVEDLDGAKEVSRGVARRQARLQRRQVDRRRRRLLGLWNLLQKNGLLPEGERQETLNALDRNLQKKFPSPYLLPYTLRAHALDHKLEPYELGRALYHLGQRRGFLTNRKAPPKDDEKPGVVTGSISKINAAMQSTNSRTLGEYFAKHVDPLTDRLRNRYTNRSMFRQEWRQIWEAQATHYPNLLTTELHDQIYNQIFHQRPLKPQDDKVGFCDLEVGCRRAPNALLAVQRFRLLGAVNNLRLLNSSGPAPEFTSEQRALTLTLASESESITFASLRKKLKLPPGVQFSVEAEESGETKLKGNLVAARFHKSLGLAWKNLTLPQQEQLVETVLNGPEDEEEAIGTILKELPLERADAEAAVKVHLPEGYYSISAKAITALLPYLEAGMSLGEAQPKQYPPVLTPPVDRLASVKEVMPSVGNPIVMRALTELRKTVNAIIARYGKPDYIHIELARDIRKGPEERSRLGKLNRDQEKVRDQAKAFLAMECGRPVDSIKRRDVEKYQLWQECNCTCPYSGEPISMTALFGDHPQFDIEHIIPLSRSLDDSFDNKTLCARDINSRKSNKTPFEAFGAQENEWEAMLGRVESFNNRRKLERFRIAEADQELLLEQFTSRHLNDTRYASKLAARYLGTLFGGIVDAEGIKRIRTCSGPITAYLRNEWKLNQILNPHGSHKSRDDHRHHAVDAVAIALCSAATVKSLSDCAARARDAGRRRFGQMPQPWENFYAQVEQKIHATNISLRPEYKLNAQMHDQTLYSAPRRDQNGKSTVHIRQAVELVKPEEIVDPQVRAAVLAKIAEVGSSKKLVDNWPTLTHPGGQVVSIKRVRVVKRETPVSFGSGAKQRFVLPNGIHHTEIVRDESAKQVKFLHFPVTVIDAMQRKREGKSIVRKEFGERQTLICTLRSGDLLRLSKSQDRQAGLWLVRTVMSSGQIALTLLSDSRKKKEIQDDSALWQPSVNVAFRSGGRKVAITHLGEEIPAND